MTRCFAVHYKRKEESPVIFWEREDDSQEPQQGTIGGTEKARKKFLDKISPGDRIYLSMGGGADKFCIALARMKAVIFRIPTHDLKRYREELELDKDDICQVLYRAAINNVNFYPFEERDQKVAQLLVLTRAFDDLQKGTRIPHQLRMYSFLNDLSLIYPDRATVTEKDILKDPSVAALIEKEKEIVKMIKPILKSLPIFKAVFDPIHRVGPLIAARLIAEIGDIRRFPVHMALISYAGWGQKDGKPRKRRKGQVANWNNNFKTVIYLFTVQVNLSPEDAPFRVLRDKYRMQDEKKNPGLSKGHYFNRANRFIAQRFLRHIYHDWCKFEELPYSSEFLIQ